MYTRPKTSPENATPLSFCSLWKKKKKKTVLYPIWQNHENEGLLCGWMYITSSLLDAFWSGDCIVYGWLREKIVFKRAVLLLAHWWQVVWRRVCIYTPRSWVSVGGVRNNTPGLFRDPSSRTEHWNAFFWKIANCFSRSQIRKIVFFFIWRHAWDKIHYYKRFLL